MRWRQGIGSGVELGRREGIGLGALTLVGLLTMVSCGDDGTGPEEGPGCGARVRVRSSAVSRTPVAAEAPARPQPWMKQRLASPPRSAFPTIVAAVPIFNPLGNKGLCESLKFSS